MKITYTGRQVELAPAQVKKIEAQFAKLGKILDGKEEREAHVTLTAERHLHRAEITVQYNGHALAGLGSGKDVSTALHTAIVKMETQAIKVRAKWRDAKRAAGKKAPEAAAIEPAPDGPKVFRVGSLNGRKPMTVDEALLEMDGGRNYLAYRDARTGGVSVLVRRGDGHFDLVEA